MKKDWVVWGGALLLFLSGFLWAQFLPNSEFWKSEFDMKPVDYFSVASAIATAIAAFAAWRSASISSVAATDSRTFSRMQAYILHKQQFEVLLSDIEKELSVIFKEKNNLYNDIFPNNRHIEKPFTMTAHGTQFDAWGETFKILVTQTNQYPPMDERELREWLIDQAMLTGDYLRFNFKIEDKSFRLGALDTHVSALNPMFSLMLSSKVLNHFYVFGMVYEYLEMSTPSHYFVESLEKFKLNIYNDDLDCDYR
ncbi:hypothetical protein [Pseudomonas fluorescens]|uniref:hypothetical protein n=1 Tax=Pseudomonas fluorescens TaxID=294 RepID=UPI0012424478|nr:hypothetical protein [Pseudomonas fluorescens]VVN43938.1 hypothetical protein PS639_05572 [Pseudomonas fluorescens]